MKTLRFIGMAIVAIIMSVNSLLVVMTMKRTTDLLQRRL